MKNFILNFTLLVLGTHLFAQNTWTVDNRPGTTAQFTTMQDAVDAASPGDFIYVHPSSQNYTNVNITKRVHLRGLGHKPDLDNGLTATVGSINIASDLASGSSISGLNIWGMTCNFTTGVASNLIISNNFFRANFLSLTRVTNSIIQGNVLSINAAILISLGSTSIHSTNLISHNIFISGANGSANDATIAFANETTSVINNLFIYSGTTGTPGAFRFSNNPIVNNNIFVINNTTSNSFKSAGSTVSYQNCLTYSFGGQTIAELPGNNNLNNTNPQFTNLSTPSNPNFDYTNNYRLSAGSLGINSGTDGTDIGIYGQGFFFQMKGYPFDLPYPTSAILSNGTVQAGSNLNLELKASANVEN